MIRLGLLVVTLCLSATACADAVEPTTRQTTAVDSPVGSPVGHTSEAEADLMLYVTNQSFADDPLNVTVSIDGVEVVDGLFHVEGQHTWVAFPLTLPPGDHEATATSDTGVQRTETFRTPGSDATRYAVLSYWFYEGEDRTFGWTFSKQPVAFD